MKCRILLSILLFGACVVFAGCAIDLAESVDETDAKVYDAIDDAWDEDLYDKGDHKIDKAVKVIDTSELFVRFSNVGKLTLPEAVAIAANYNRAYSTEKEMLYLTALKQIDVEHLYEPIPFVGSGGGIRQDGTTRTRGGAASGGVQQLLATGARVGTGLSLGWVDILSGDARSGFSTIASAVITQPLLRGAGRKVVLENLTQAQQNTLYQVRSFNRYRKSFITSVISNYYQVVQQEEKYLNAFDHYEKLVETYVNLQKRSEAGKVSKHEYQQADQDMLIARSNYIQARKEYHDLLDVFKMQLAIAPNAEFKLDIAELDALKEAITQDLELSEEQAIQIALDQRLDLANAFDQVIDAERKVDVAGDAIRAELNLIGSVGRESVSKSMFGVSGSKHRESQNRYNLSMELDLPIDRVAEENAYRRALIDLLRVERRHKEVNDTVILEVRSAHRKMQETQLRYEIEMQSQAVAEKRASNTMLLLKYGRANTRDVLDALDDQLDSKDAITESLVAYTTASLDFYRDTGMMKINPDGMWEKRIPLHVYASE